MNKKLLSIGQKSPSFEAQKRTTSRSTQNGGVTVDSGVAIERIRETSRKLNENTLQDASFVYTPSSYGEGRNFVQNPNDILSDLQHTRNSTSYVTNKDGSIGDGCYNLVANSDTGATQTITVSSGTYNLSFYGTGSYTLSGVSIGTLTGVDINTRVNNSFACSSGSLTITKTGSTSKLQFSLGGLKDYLKTTNRLNVPNIDYFLDLTKPSLLIQPQRTNLLLNSLTGTTQNVTVTAQTHTLSFYGTGSYTLSGVATGVLNGTGTSNRVALTFTPTAGTLTLTVSGSITEVQLESGSNATSRIRTTSSTATRNADIIKLTNNSNILPQSEGAIFLDFYHIGDVGQFAASGLVMLTDINTNATASYMLNFRFNAKDRLAASVFYSNVLQVDFGGGANVIPVVSGQNHKVIFKYSSTVCSLFLDGVKVATQSGTFNIPTNLNYMHLGTYYNSTSNISVNNLVMFPTVLTDAECIAMTTL